jgi:hypothetical protein
MRAFHSLLSVGLISLLFISPTLQAAESTAAGDCVFNPPQAVLQPKAYAGYTFTRQTSGRAIEAARVRDNLRVEISLSQCVDLIISEITFIVPRSDGPEFDENYWLEFARTEIGSLKRNALVGDYRELQQFLARARDIAPRDNKRSMCKDSSMAEAGQCSWESMGGFIFQVKKTGPKIRISATEYTSG